MTNSQPDRLDHIKALVESNARLIEALSLQLSESSRETAEQRRELRQATVRVIELTEGIANLTARS